MGVQIFEIIQKRLGWTDYRMAKELGMAQIRYANLRKNVRKTTPKTLLKLMSIAARELQMSRVEFWDIFEATEKD